MTKTAMMTGNDTDMTITDRRFSILPGGKEKRIRNRFGGELPQYARICRHEDSRFTAELKDRSARREERQVLSAVSGADPDCDFQLVELCPISQEPKVEDGVIKFATEDGDEITIVYVGGTIASAHIAPARRYY